jgi:hypothetical protein
MTNAIPHYSSWRAMQELNRDGQIRAIGVANFYPDRLVDLIDHNEIAPAVDQIETHPFFQRLRGSHQTRQPPRRLTRALRHAAARSTVSRSSAPARR